MSLRSLCVLKVTPEWKWLDKVYRKSVWSYECFIPSHIFQNLKRPRPFSPQTVGLCSTSQHANGLTSAATGTQDCQQFVPILSSPIGFTQRFRMYGFWIPGCLATRDNAVDLGIPDFNIPHLPIWVRNQPSKRVGKSLSPLKHSNVSIRYVSIRWKCWGWTVCLCESKPCGEPPNLNHKMPSAAENYWAHELLMTINVIRDWWFHWHTTIHMVLTSPAVQNFHRLFGRPPFHGALTISQKEMI